MKIHCSALIVLLAAVMPIEAAEAPKPNVLLIVADDLGYSDIGCYGSEIRTPNLDGLAAGGLRFTQFYNTARCWSSRAAILTGYYPQAIRRDVVSGIAGNKAGPKGGLATRPGWAKLLPDFLKQQGYRSYHSGKWHLDGNPMENGFDHAYQCDNANGYFSQKGQTEDGVKLLVDGNAGAFYSTTSIADHAIRYLKEHAVEHKGQPFFQYLAFHSPHFPVQALPEDIAVYKGRYDAGWDALRVERLERMKKLGIVDCALSPLDPVTVPSWNLSEEQLKKKIGGDEVGHAVPWKSLTPGQQKFQAEKMSVHAAMVHRMDIEIGRVIEQVKSMGALDNTLVIFVSDNGASAEQIIRGGGEDPSAPVGSAGSYLGIGPGWSSAANTPFRLHKSWNHEGGISTPLIIRWNAGIPAHNELRRDPGHLVDLAPTVLELADATRPPVIAGLPVPPLHGMSLVPDFMQDGRVKHDFLWWNHVGNRAIRMGDWKLVADHQSPWELYDLRTDRSETKNLAAANQDRVKDMEKEWMKRAASFEELAKQDPPPPGGRKKNKKAAAEEEE